MNNETVFSIFKTDAELKDFMLDFLKNNIEDFRACENEFDISMSNLKNSLSQEKAEELTELISLMYRKVIAGIKYELMLGIKANYDYYNAPATGNFLESDMGIYTKEKTLNMLPTCVEAQRNIIRLNKRLEIEDGEFYDGIREYFIYLETVCPKLAHYFGYIMANDLFTEIVPGYAPSIEHTGRYTFLLEEYFGCKLDVTGRVADCEVDLNG